MNISSNPWTFTNADVTAFTQSVPTASPNGLVQGGPGALALVTLTTVGNHNLVANQFITIIGTTNGRFRGWYKVIAVPTVTTALLANLSSPTSGQPFNTVLAGDGGGTVIVNQVQQNARIEDISAQATQAADTAGDLLLLDRNGSLIWRAALGGNPAGTSSLAQNRGKVMWVDGLTLQTIPVGYTILATIN